VATAKRSEPSTPRKGRQHAKQPAPHVVIPLDRLLSDHDIAKPRPHFSREEERELLALIGGRRPTEAHKEFVWRLNHLPSIGPLEGRIPSAASMRKELESVKRDVRQLVSRLMGMLQVGEHERTQRPDGLSSDARQRLADAIYPVLTRWFQDLLRDDRWCRKLPREVRYLVIFERALVEICTALDATCRLLPAKDQGGRPRQKSKQTLVDLIVRDYRDCFAELPATTKESNFEEIVRRILTTHGFKPGNVHELIRGARQNVKAQPPLESRRISK